MGPSGYARCVSGGVHPTDSNSIPSGGEGVEAGDASLRLPVLEVAGELDLAVAPWLRDQLDALFVGGASTALGVLVAALNRCDELGGEVHLVVTEPQVLRVLRITGLTDAFTLHQSRNELLGGSEGRKHGCNDV
jgi:anti-sigma B factor antagonist